MASGKKSTPPSGGGRDTGERPRPRSRSAISKEKLDMLGALSKSCAHEINNVLAAITGFASVLEHQLEEGSPLLQDVNGILAASRRGVDLTRNMMSFGSPSKGKTQQLSINESVRMARSLLMRNIPPTVDVDLRLANDAGYVDANPVQLRQMLLNLGQNAAEAIRKQGRVIISTERVVLPDNSAECTNCPPGPYVRLRVSDTGDGMSSSALDRCFDPFFTTKPAAAGLGLSFVGTTVEQHGGSVSIFSKEGLGTTVTVHLPQVAAVEEPRVVESPPAAPTVSKGVVMIVDDDPLVLRGARRLLETLQFEVISASNGSEAVRLYKERMEDIALVLLDLVMPDQDGIEVLGELRKIEPNVSVVVASGYPMEEPSASAATLGVRGVLRKPYTASQVEAVLKGAFA